MKYCTYVTFYRGNRLPPFYIGYSLTHKVLERRYHGSVSSKRYREIWKEELRDHPELFETVILTRHETKEEANDRERRFQQSLRVIKNDLYINLASSKHEIDRTGVRHTPEAIEKCRKAKLGKKLSSEHRTKIGLAQKGRVFSPQHLKNLRANTTRGRPLSEEHKKKLSTSHLGNEGYWTGKKLSPEHIEKLRASRLGKPNLKARGKKRSPEARARMSEAAKARWSKHVG